MISARYVSSDSSESAETLDEGETGAAGRVAAFDRMIASGDTDAIAQAPAMDEDAEGWAGWVSHDHIGDLGPGTPAVDAALALQLLLDPRARSPR